MNPGAASLITEEPFIKFMWAELVLVVRIRQVDCLLLVHDLASFTNSTIVRLSTALADASCRSRYL